MKRLISLLFGRPAESRAHSRIDAALTRIHQLEIELGAEVASRVQRDAELSSRIDRLQWDRPAGRSNTRGL